MKIILSRKGFDSANGGMPSPIFPDGRIISLPIPTTRSPTTINDLINNKYNLSDVISDLSKKKLHSNQHVHVDPDVDFNVLANRPKDWRGAFGQVGAAQSHLSNNKVGKGDLFVYFGWFREVEQHNKVWQFKQKAPDLHVIYGWLLVEEVINIYRNDENILIEHPWLKYHPHLCGTNYKQNTIYVGSKTLPPEVNKTESGYGVFSKISNIQTLTDKSQCNRSIWKLPASFYPGEGKPALTYHGKKERWTSNNESVILKSVGRGQEFVLDIGFYPDTYEWLINLFTQPLNN